jgi:hypothetical protein
MRVEYGGEGELVKSQRQSLRWRVVLLVQFVKMLMGCRPAVLLRIKGTGGGSRGGDIAGVYTCSGRELPQ